MDHKKHSLTELRNFYYDRLGFRKICEFLQYMKISPNHITSINLVLSLFAVYFLFRNFTFFIIFLSLRVLIDCFDGYYASTTNSTSKLGYYLDHVGDLIFSYLIIIKSYFYLSYWWIILIVSFMATETLIVYIKNWYTEKLPAFVYLIFYTVGLWKFGLLFQLFYQPISFVIYYIKKSKA